MVHLWLLNRFLLRQGFCRLDPERIDLGKGKRSIYRGGRFDAKYRITVPRQEEVPNV